MFTKNKKQKEQSVQNKVKKPDVKLDGVIIHTMPEAFFGRKAQLKEKKTIEPKSKLKAKLAIKPVIKPKPVVIKQSVKKFTAKGKMIIVTLIVLLSIVLSAYFVLYSSKQQAVEVAVPAVKIIPPVEDDINKEPSVPVPGVDTDSDGLTDVEEELYGTQSRNPDSDNDTFLDGNEIFHRYSPLGESPATLLDTGAVTIFTDHNNLFTLTYPIKWNINENLSDPVYTEIKTDKLASFRINYFITDNGLDFEVWYKENIDNDVRFSKLKETFSKEGYNIYFGQDERSAYLITDNDVYLFTYDLGGSLTVDYLQTFKMLINSFVMIND